MLELNEKYFMKLQQGTKLRIFYAAVGPEIIYPDKRREDITAEDAGNQIYKQLVLLKTRPCRILVSNVHITFLLL